MLLLQRNCKFIVGCNSMQIFIHCKTTLHVSGVTAPIIRSIKTCTRSLRYRSYYLYRKLRVQFLILLMMGAVTPETCRVVLLWINMCILLHLLDFYSHWITMHGTTSLKKFIVGVLSWFRHYLIVVLRERSVIVAVHMADTSVFLIPCFTFLLDISPFPIRLCIFLLLGSKEVKHRPSVPKAMGFRPFVCSTDFPIW